MRGGLRSRRGDGLGLRARRTRRGGLSLPLDGDRLRRPGDFDASRLPSRRSFSLDGASSFAPAAPLSVSDVGAGSGRGLFSASLSLATFLLPRRSRRVCGCTRPEPRGKIGYRRAGAQRCQPVVRLLKFKSPWPARVWDHSAFQLVSNFQLLTPRVKNPRPFLSRKCATGPTRRKRRLRFAQVGAQRGLGRREASPSSHALHHSGTGLSRGLAIGIARGAANSTLRS